MEASIAKLFNSVTNFFTGDDRIPWTNPDFVAECERKVDECSSDAERSDCILNFSWALVHSKRPDDVQRGIAMLETLLADSKSTPVQETTGATKEDNGSKSNNLEREKVYLLAVGLYRSGNYSRSRQLVNRCLEIEPGWRQALSLEKAIEDKITKDGVIGIGITATAVGVLAGGLAVALSGRKK